MKRTTLAHIRYVKTKYGTYTYFNTGRKTSKGRPVYIRLPDPASTGFWDSYSAAMGHRDRVKDTAYTVATLVDEYQRSADFRSKAQATQDAYNSALHKIVHALGHFPANSLEPPHVREFLDLSEYKAGTYNLVKAVIGTAFTWARERGKTTARPTQDIKNHDGGSHEPWPDDILQAALASKDDTIRLAVHLLYFTGQRLGDVCNMRWGDIQGGRMVIRQRKTRKHVDPPLTAELKAELDRTPKRGLFILDGIRPQTLRLKLKAFTRAMGVETVPHGLRKNAVNSLLEAGCTIAEVAAITGQSFAMVEYYAARVNTSGLGSAAVLKWDAKRA